MSRGEPVPVVLPERHWLPAADADGAPRALLLHGINGDGGTWWRVGARLAELGYAVTSVDLRGHGTAPRTDDHRHAAYAADLPDGPWDLLIGHSLGAAIAVVAAADDAHLARRIVLLDPVLRLDPEEFDAVRDAQLDELGDTLETIAAERPHWHPDDVAAKHAAAQRVDRAAVEGTFADNRPWDIVDRAIALAVPTLVVGADPAVSTTFPPATETVVTAANPRVTGRRIPGAGHSVHRDRFDETLTVIRSWLAG